ncbi:hypothetical protein ACWD1W_06375 [Streptomyces olivaceoviridis]
MPRTSSTGGSPAGTPRSLLTTSSRLLSLFPSEEFAAAGNRVYLPIAD